MLDFDNREKLILGCGAGAALLGFFPWFRLSFAGVEPEMAQFFGQIDTTTSANALASTEGLLAWLAALATVAVLVADRGRVFAWSDRARVLAPVVAAGASFLFMLMFLCRGGSFSAMGISGGKTVWFYAAVASMGVAGWQAFARMRELQVRVVTV